MTARRTAAPVLCGGLALVALAGCSKPTPAVTLVSDGKRVRTEATVYCRDGQSLAKKNCPTSGHGPTVLPVRQGSQVGVDVDRTLAQHGWYLVDADAKRRSPVQGQHYFTFTADFTGRPIKGVINLEVLSVDKVAEKATVTGSWVLQLLQR